MLWPRFRPRKTLFNRQRAASSRPACPCATRTELNATTKRGQRPVNSLPRRLILLHRSLTGRVRIRKMRHASRCGGWRLEHLPQRALLPRSPATGGFAAANGQRLFQHVARVLVRIQHVVGHRPPAAAAAPAALRALPSRHSLPTVKPSAAGLASTPARRLPRIGASIRRSGRWLVAWPPVRRHQGLRPSTHVPSGHSRRFAAAAAAGASLRRFRAFCIRKAHARMLGLPLPLLAGAPGRLALVVAGRRRCYCRGYSRCRRMCC